MLIHSFAVDSETLSQQTCRSSLSVIDGTMPANHRDFKILVDNKTNGRHCIHLAAPTVEDREAWISDISQCIDNIHLHKILSPSNDQASIGGMFSKMLLKNYFEKRFVNISLQNVDFSK